MSDADAKRMRAALEEAQDERKALRRAVRTLEEERDGWEKKAKASALAAAALKLELEQARSERGALREELRRAEAEREGLTTTVVQLKKALRAAGLTVRAGGTAVRGTRSPR